MSHWNYRVVHKEGDEDSYTIGEIYYDDAGRVTTWLVDERGIPAFGETLEELADDLELMLAACELPVLEEAELPDQ